ncbi:unnamed protein product [Citrullus colocynthis]|uniref:Uncharacterized protein n=1 Tax=Citrullus colocynthis TaxID=252529 RepID=A0ABP0Z5H2_9ROSI
MVIVTKNANNLRSRRQTYKQLNQDSSEKLQNLLCIYVEINEDMIKPHPTYPKENGENLTKIMFNEHQKVYCWSLAKPGKPHDLLKPTKIAGGWLDSNYAQAVS